MNELLKNVSLLDVAAVLAAAGVIYGLVVKVWPVLAKIKDLIDDFAGEPARSGVPARPGLMERLASVELMAGSADYHSRPNGGGSAYDALMREIRGLHARVGDLDHGMHTRVDELDRKITAHISLSNAERAALREDVDIVLLQKTDN